MVADYLVVARVEYLKGELPAVLIPALLACVTLGALLAVEVLLSIVVFALLYVTGFLVNAVTDREVDLRYGSFKRGIGEAASRLGDRRILAIVGLQTAVGLALTVELARRLENFWLVPLAGVGLFLGIAYSAPPFSLKTRGVAAHALSLALSAFTVPFLFLYLAARGALDLPGLLVVGAFTVVGYALEYANQAYDFTEDLEAGLATPVVRLGLVRSLRLAVAAFVVALPVLAFSLAYLALTRPAVAYGLGEGARPLIVAGAVGAVLAGYAIPLRGLSRILRAAREEAADSQALVERVRRECNYSLWQTSGVSGLFAFALAVFLVSASAASDLREASVGAYGFEGAATATPEGQRALRVEGALRAQGEEAPAGGPGTIVVEWRGPGGAQRLAAVPVELPEPGGSVPFQVGGVRLPAGGGTLHVALLVDTDFDGAPDLQVASAPVEGADFP
ncbi:MAG TPA: UbiA family prenyltransferase [Candidatus Thermoplasmatota archaeon]